MTRCCVGSIAVMSVMCGGEGAGVSLSVTNAEVVSKLALGDAGPLAESPAEEAGVLAGERLLEISEPWDGHVSLCVLLFVCSTNVRGLDSGD